MNTGLTEDACTKIYMLHFDEKSFENVTCYDCLDFKTAQCSGKNYKGYECVECMKDHAKNSHRTI